MPLNHELSDLFHNLSALMELKGENVFKVIAFQKVGRILRELNIDLKRCVEEGKLCEIEGVGKGSQQIIEEYIQTGKSTVFEEVAATVPPGLIPMMQIEGLGPKTINLLWRERNVTSLDELEKAIANGSIQTLKGMGEKKITTIAKGIEAFKARTADGSSAVPRRTGIAEAEVQAVPLRDALRKMKQVKRAEVAGSLRRRRETVADVDLIASVKDMSHGGAVSDAFAKLPGIIQVMVCGPSKCSVRVANGMQVDLRIVPDESFGAALMYFTGSKDHNVKVRGIAQKKGMTLNEWGLYKLDEYETATKEIAKPPSVKAVASASEQEIYAKLGLDYIDPEMREDLGEVDLARQKKLPVLITRADYRGDLHAHTIASDGTGTIEQMAAAAQALGYEYLAITDHSKALAMTNGLSVERLMLHVQEVRRVSDRSKGIKLLAGSEVDILVDGRLDYDDDVLRELDLVIASPHVSLKQDARKATDRIRRAIDNRYVHFIGHPTGRLINGREGLPLEMDEIFRAAAQSGTALEINSGYPRLDLNDVNARHAIEAGCMLTINTDAHATTAFEEIVWGLGVARRAWATKQHVINCMGYDELRAFLRRKR